MLAPLRGTGLWLLELRTDAAALWPRGKGQRAKGPGGGPYVQPWCFSSGGDPPGSVHRPERRSAPLFPLKHGALLKLHVEGERRRSLQGRIFSRLFLLPVPSGCAGRRGGPECQAPAHRTKSAQGREAKGGPPRSTPLHIRAVFASESQSAPLCLEAGGDSQSRVGHPEIGSGSAERGAVRASSEPREVQPAAEDSPRL